jgi:hypothetical protein
MVHVEFGRKLSTGDSDDVEIDGMEYRFIYAIRYEESHDGMGGKTPNLMGFVGESIRFYADY